MNNEQVIYLSHTLSPHQKQAFSDLKRTCGEREAVFLFHGSEGSSVPEPNYCFTDEVLEEMDYPTMGDSLYGHVHFPLFDYYHTRCGPGVEHLWFVENDVRFTGDWKVLFDYYEDTNYDLIASHIMPYGDHPDWGWWDLEHPREHIPPEERLRSFNPVYRLSARAVEYLDRAFRDGWKGHNEVTFPTLLSRAGFSLLDMGNRGPYVDEQGASFYLSYSLGNMVSGIGTMRYRPVYRRAGWLKHKLYHPVKPKEEGGLLRSLSYYLDKLNLWSRGNHG